MPTRAEAQLAFDEQLIEDADIEAALEEREKRKASLSAMRADYNEAHEKASAEIAKLELPVGGAARVGRFRITRAVLKARSVSFETEESIRIRIALIEDDEAPEPTPIRSRKSQVPAPAPLA